MFKKAITLAVFGVVIMLVGCSLVPVRTEGPNYLSIADNYYSKLEYDNALEYYLLASEIDDNNSEIYYKIGLIYGIYHSQKLSDDSIIGGRQSQKKGVIRKKESDYSLAVKYFTKAAELGHVEARQLLRAMHNNIQHQDVKY